MGQPSKFASAIHGTQSNWGNGNPWRAGAHIIHPLCSKFDRAQWAMQEEFAGAALQFLQASEQRTAKIGEAQLVYASEDNAVLRQKTRSDM